MIREAFLQGAAAAADLIGHPSVAAAWNAPSVLPGYRVGGLCGHLARNVVLVEPLLAAPASGARPLPLLDHYTGDDWLDADPQSEEHLAIRERGEKAAADGPGSLAERVSGAVGRLAPAVAAQPADRVVDLPGMWSLTLDDFLLTRLVELTVHCDDLAVSVGEPTPELPAAHYEETIALLSRLAVRRHGPTALLRALSRSERAPATVSAF
ncbi:maleylpyruvate isomerase N-terminal domain-containing protein [Streptomyces genisteinicus]|uniref:Maleylpyruvate isomerase N-terminal domain-containing protein n=1 Tax=Streptomyces genisteinicus TaxID=2768068 RepID=A0A7H0I1H0_9ACTN|nr:maleylpyruvate isomerase N-terminal domain-containing protein [Streptomyces genisteinicus]QNP66636.1 maleylpyruvate isomerase N-terminal domain-containing protein [Streptomyces genisteinicus]